MKRRSRKTHRLWALAGASAAFVACQSESPEPAQALVDPARWGKTVDPDGDCRITTTGARLSIHVPGTPHALVIERNQLNAPRVMR